MSSILIKSVYCTSQWRKKKWHGFFDIVNNNPSRILGGNFMQPDDHVIVRVRRRHSRSDQHLLVFAQEYPLKSCPSCPLRRKDHLEDAATIVCAHSLDALDILLSKRISDSIPRFLLVTQDISKVEENRVRLFTDPPRFKVRVDTDGLHHTSAEKVSQKKR